MTNRYRESLLAERAHYQEMFATADGNEETRRLAETRLVEIDTQLARLDHRNGAGGAAHPPNPGNRWPQVDLIALIRESGCTLREKRPGKLVGDHAPKHGSRSGECLVIWPDEGRWHCTSCKAGGDAAGWLADLEGIPYAEAARRLEARFGPAPSRYDHLPWIDAACQDLRVITAHAWDALRAANEPAPFIFRFGGLIVRLERDDHGVLLPVELTSDRLRHVLARCANFYKEVDAGDGRRRVIVRPPAYVVQDVLATPDPPLPMLRRIADVPVFAADGSLQTTSGYHPESRLYYDPTPGLALSPVPDRPTEADVARARSLVLDELLVDFPFVSEADRAHAVALFLLPFVRDLVDGPTPLHLIEAPTEGSGKGLLAEVCLIPAVGRRFGTMTAGRDSEEWRKAITSALRAGHDVTWIDNVTRPLDSGDLAAALTTHVWEDRLLGKSETLRLPVRVTWVATANNPVVSREIMRRTVRIRIDPRVDEPWLRTNFKHPNLRAWAWEHRADLIRSALVLAQNWLARGRPAPTVRPLGSYEAWTHVIGGILAAAGIGGFLGNLDEFYRTANTEVAAWRAFVTAWWEAHQDTPVLVKDLLPIALDIEALDVAGKDEKGQARSLGKKLERQRDRVIGGYRITKAGAEHRAIRWRLRPCSPSGPSGADGEFCEFGEFSAPMQNFDAAPVAAPAESHTKISARTQHSQNSQNSPVTPQPIAAGWEVQIADGSWHRVARVREEAGERWLTLPTAGRTIRATDARDARPPAPCLGPGPDPDDEPPDPDGPDPDPGPDGDPDPGPDPGHGLNPGSDRGPTEDPSAGDGGATGGEGGEGVAGAGAGVRSGLAPTPDYRLLRDAEAVQEALPTVMAQPVLGLDTETTGLDPLTDRLRLVQLAVPGGPVYLIDCFAVDPRVLAPLLADPVHGPVLVGHNLGFDVRFLLAAGLPVPHGRRLFDTMLAAQLIDAGLPKSGHALADLARRFLGVELPKALQRADWSGALSPAMLTYAARDAAIVLPLRERLMAELGAAGLSRVAAVEMRALPAVAWLEHIGVPFDAEAWRALADAALLEKLRLVDELTARAEGLLGKNRLFGREINWDSPGQVLRLLQEAGLSLPNTSEDALQAHREHPLVAALLAYREAAKRCGTYGLNVLADVHPATRRVHPNWFQIGAATGRMACTRPNLQNVPRTPAYRACFRAPDGRVLIKADYSQIELRIAAEISGDAALIAAYQRGEDVHTATARAVLGRAEVTDADRQLAKALNFGLLFGMGVARFREHAASGYGVHLTDDEARRFRERFFATYPGLRRWHRAQADGPMATRTLAGRRRLGVERFSEKLNSPVQGTGADGLKAALALLWETRHRCPSAAPVLAVHDEIVLECDAPDAEAAREWVTDCMLRGMRQFLPHVPVVVEATVARDWSGAPAS